MVNITRKHSHPNPSQWANYIAICGIDRGHFSDVSENNGVFTVTFHCGLTIIVTAGKLQKNYLL